MRIAVISFVLLPALLAAAPCCGQVQSLEAWWICQGPTDSTYLGGGCASLGDINNDGFADFIVGSSGQAYIYFGAAQPDTNPQMVIPCPDSSAYYFGNLVFQVGDVNGDEAVDFLIWMELGAFCHRIYLYYGGPQLDTIPDLVFKGSDNSTSNYGIYAAGLGDLNADGGNDFAILDNSFGVVYPTVVGQALIYFGGVVLDTLADWKFTADSIFNQVGGGNIAALGDINNDGSADFILSDPSCTNPDGETYAGYLALFFGGANPDTVPAYVIWGAQSSLLGTSVAGIDFNHDGLRDIVAGTGQDFPPNHTSSIYVYLLGQQMNNVPDYTFLDNGNFGDGTGDGLLGIDLSGDGWQDIVSCNHTNVLNAGKVFVYLGGAETDTLLDALYFQGNVAASLGAGAANVGDINGDGLEDLVIGEPGYNGYYTWNYWGRIHVILGDTIYHQSVGVAPGEMIPPVPSVLQLSIYPNPANPFVAASFELRVASNMSLDVYDLLGRRVAELASGFHLPGEYRYVWDARNRAAGMYIIRLKTGRETVGEKLVILK